MFEFKKIWDTFEGLSALERRQLLEEKSGSVFHELQSRTVPEGNPKEILAGFLIGSAMIDGKLNEMEYLLMYPSLVRTFGADFDFRSLKERFRRNRDGKKLVGDYVEKVLGILRFSEEVLKRDVVILCLRTPSTPTELWKAIAVFPPRKNGFVFTIPANGTIITTRDTPRSCENSLIVT